MKVFFLKQILLLNAAVLIAACNSSDSPEPDIELTTLSEINKLRVGGCYCGDTFYPSVDKVDLNSYLKNAAFAHAIDMNERDYFDHISPDGTSPQQRANQAGYQGKFIAENIAYGYSSATETIQAWQDSPSHCEAMMDKEVNEIGVAHTHDHWVLEMGHSGS